MDPRAKDQAVDGTNASEDGLSRPINRDSMVCYLV